MPHTTCASTLLEDQLAQLGFTITTADNPAAAAAAATDGDDGQITNAPRRITADITAGKASARLLISGWDDADGLVLVKTRAGIDTIRTDDTPDALRAAASEVAALVRLDNTGRNTIEVHPGECGRLYLHDPLDHLRFGPHDSYASREGARLAAAVADPNALIVDR